MPSQGVVYQVVRDHFETFRAQAAGLRDGEGLPRFVEQAAFAHSAPASLAEALAEAGVSRVAALRMPGRPPSRVALRRASPKPWRRRAASRTSAVMTVGLIGSSRFRVKAGRSVPVAALRPVENLRVVVSPVERRPCSGPSRATSRDGGRRMAERAAHLVDHVFPAVPVRQWVLTLPPRLRYRLAWDHDLCRAVALRRCSGPSRARSRDGRCLGSDGPRLPAACGPPGWGAGRARRSRRDRSALRRGDESERSRPCARHRPRAKRGSTSRPA